MRSSILTILVFGALALACGGSSSTSTGTSSGGNGGGTTSSNGGNGGAGGNQTGGGGSGGNQTGGGGSGGNQTGGGGTGGTADVPVVLNEIQATGEDYVELVNTGAMAFDLANYGLADSMGAGEPKIADAARFPAGTVLAPGDHLLVVAEQDPAAGVGPHDVCLAMGGPTVCFYATWGLSAAKGEKVFLLSPADAVVAEAEYPMNAVVAPSTWGRLPDGTGAFAETAPTPGEANKAP
jgi:hypothetical protein